MPRVLTDCDRAFARQMRLCRSAQGLSAKSVIAKLPSQVYPADYSKWENERAPVPNVHLVAIARVLGIHEGYSNSLIVERAKVSPQSTESKYVEESFSDLIERGVQESEVFDAVKKIIDEFPAADIDSPQDGSNDFGDPEKWNRLISSYPDLFKIVSERSTGNYVAYWMILSISDELYDRTIVGENINRECEYSDTHGFFVPRDHNIYVVDMFTRRSYLDRIPLNRVIFEGFFSLIREMALNGHFIKRIATHASEIRSERICHDLGMQLVCNHKYHRRHKSETDKTLVPTKVFALDISAGDMSIFNRLKDSTLHDLYQKHFKNAFARKANSGG